MPIAVMLPTVEQLKGFHNHGSPTVVFFQYLRQCKFYLAYTVYATWRLLSIPVCKKPTAFLLVCQTFVTLLLLKYSARYWLGDFRSSGGGRLLDFLICNRYDIHRVALTLTRQGTKPKGRYCGSLLKELNRTPTADAIFDSRAKQVFTLALPLFTRHSLIKLWTH